jgi:polysaccharide pyruvyl transferase WcaK-like protein
MYIEIRKAEFVNKGAELMLRAAVEQVRARYPDVRLVMAPGHEKSAAPFSKRAALGFYQKAWLWRSGWQLGDLAALAPRRLREAYGVVLDREINAVLDAAGFLYSDQQGAKYNDELARASQRWKRHGTKLILLPQAFGPYRSARSREAVRRFVANADLIYARDADSYGHLVEAAGTADKIRTCPDFTNLTQGFVPAGFQASALQVAIVPNCRMLDKLSAEVSAQYEPFLERVARSLVKRGERPFFLVHESKNDRAIAERVAAAAGGLPIIEETDALAIKGILGACKAQVGSRFHGLVSALSQGVPSLAAGWSHKYRMLFKDYEFDQGMLDVAADAEQLEHALDLITKDGVRERIAARLLQRSAALKRQTQAMWAEVFACIGS